MMELAQTQPGFLGVESVDNAPVAHAAAGDEPEKAVQSITVSYWRDREAIEGWRRNGEHAMAQARGRKEWYERFEVRVSEVEKTYGFVA